MFCTSGWSLSAYYKTENPNMDLTCNECWEWRMTTKRPVLSYFIAHLFDIESCIHSFIHSPVKEVSFHNEARLQADIQRRTLKSCPCLWKWVWTGQRQTDGRTDAGVYNAFLAAVMEMLQRYKTPNSLILLYKVKEWWGVFCKVSN